MRQPFPFIVGSPRSGSTLLRTMLDGHSRMAIPPESHFISAFLRSPALATRFEFGQFLAQLSRHPRFRLWRVSLHDIAAVAEPPESLAPALRAVYAAYARQHGKDRYGDKTPAYAMHVRPIAGLLPEAVFVHLVRDGRDVAMSLLDVPFGPNTVADAAAYWKHRVASAMADGEELGASRYMLLRYEDLVRDPEAALRTVCTFAGIDFEPAMLDHRRNAAAIAASTLDPDVHGSLDAPLHLARDWRRDMPRRDVDQFEAIAGDSLRELGYRLRG